ncbi:hypothetical protein Kyoto169A_00400 [Helicobacter pylori]
MKYSPTPPKLNPPNPIRAHYMRKLVGAGSFILVVKTLKGINLITDTPVKRPNAKAIGLPDVGGEFGSHSVSLIIGILQSLSSNAFPTGLTHHIL